MKRVFVAILMDFPHPSLWKRGEKLAELKNIRWIQSKNLHLTLVPPWEEEEMEAVSSKLSGVSCKPFEIRLDRITFGPNPQQPRLIWATGPKVAELENLQRQVLSVLGKIPDRPLLPHVTVAHFKSEDFKHFPVQNLNEPINWQVKVNFFALMESHLSPAGSDYEILNEFAF